MGEAGDLSRFVQAQEPVYQIALQELRNGRKRTHWMWFIFPQLRGLGSSWMAIRYGLGSRAEADAYLQHPILGSRLTECAELVTLVEGRTIEQIFGYPDHLKFWSSITLFAQVSRGDKIFVGALGKYFDGALDRLTMERLAGCPPTFPH